MLLNKNIVKTNFWQQNVLNVIKNSSAISIFFYRIHYSCHMKESECPQRLDVVETSKNQKPSRGL